MITPTDHHLKPATRRWAINPIGPALFGAMLLVSDVTGATGSNGTGGPLGNRQDWPCTGCLFQAPDDLDPGKPAPLIVTFHGDEGNPGYTHRSFQSAASDAGFLLLSLIFKSAPTPAGMPTATLMPMGILTPMPTGILMGTIQMMTPVVAGVRQRVGPS